MRPVHAAVDAVFGKQLQGIGVHGPAHECADSGAAEADIARFHALAKQVFRRRAAADIAHADDQYTFEHNIEALPQSGSGSVRRWTCRNHASFHPCEASQGNNGLPKGLAIVDACKSGNQVG